MCCLIVQSEKFIRRYILMSILTTIVFSTFIFNLLTISVRRFFVYFTNQDGEFTYVVSRLSHFARTPARPTESFTGIQDERVSPHIYDERLNAWAWCADTNPLPRGLSATYSSRYTARKIILVLKWRIILRDVFNDAPYTRFVPVTARCTLVFYKRLFRKRLSARRACKGSKNV